MNIMHPLAVREMFACWVRRVFLPPLPVTNEKCELPRTVDLTIDPAELASVLLIIMILKLGPARPRRSRR